MCEVEEVVQGHISTMANAQERDRLTEELKEIMNSNLLYVTHLLRTCCTIDLYKPKLLQFFSLESELLSSSVM